MNVAVRGLQGRVGLIMGIHSLMAIIIRPFFGPQIDLKGERNGGRF